MLNLWIIIKQVAVFNSEAKLESMIMNESKAKKTD